MISVTEINGKCTHIAAVKKRFWNARYGENEIVYGRNPNVFFKQFIDNHKPGSILLPAEGEGRNAVYAALKGWQVDAFDFSEQQGKRLCNWQKRMVLRSIIGYRILQIIEQREGTMPLG